MNLIKKALPARQVNFKQYRQLPVIKAIGDSPVAFFVFHNHFKTINCNLFYTF